MKEYYPEGLLLKTEENKKYIQNSASLAVAQSLGVIVEATVTMCDAQHNLIVDLGIMKGIIPRDEGAIGIREGITRDIALISRVGKPVCFVITDFATDENGRPYALLSRKSAQEKCRDYILNNKTVGDIIDAKITHLESFGAFCDIGCGNIALLPIDAISVSRISHPSDRFKTGDMLRVIIKNIDSDKKITLSHKDGVRVGQTASVYIKSIIPEKMKIKLIIIDSFNTAATGKSKYFYNDEHITEFIYSPPECYKQIITHF